MKHLHLFEQYPYLADEEFHEDRKLLLLDMDGAMVYEDDRINPRPHYQEFLNYAFKNFRVGVFTARPEHDALAAIHALGIDPAKLDCLYTEQDCDFDEDFDEEIMSELFFIKDLTWLKEDLAEVIIMDDVPEGCVRNPHNLLYIPPFYDEPDDYLLRVIHILDELKKCPDVRTIDKRNWWR